MGAGIPRYAQAIKNRKGSQIMMTKDEAKILLGALQMLEGLIKPEDEVSVKAFTRIWNSIASIVDGIDFK
jgi:predicted DNA-binding transcriptional regulator YafY